MLILEAKLKIDSLSNRTFVFLVDLSMKFINIWENMRLKIQLMLPSKLGSSQIVRRVNHFLY